jgi:dihydropteroate synthase
MKIRGELKEFSSPMVMGILNITDDSFFAGSRVNQEEEILSKAKKMLGEGADILDIGAYSTRPGASEVSVKEETVKIEKAGKILREAYPNSILSVDTFRTEVAKSALEMGFDLVNDISGGQDKGMFELIAEHDVPYICMHMRGNPQTMQSLTHYDDIIFEMATYFKQKVDRLRQLGVKDVILDPGFGFAKTVEQNYFILKNLDYFQILECPLLIGLSRKSMIYKVLNTTSQEALNGTIALNAFALSKGANILRVHDVKEAVETITLFKQILN